MVGEYPIRRDWERAGFAEGLRVTRELERAQIERLRLDAPAADKQQMTRSESRFANQGNHNPTLFRFTEQPDFDCFWTTLLAGDVKEVFAIWQERRCVVGNISLVKPRSRQNLSP